MNSSATKWYTSWFNTPFYHILYKDRDYAEAQKLMDNLTSYLNLPERAQILDLACGKGRHSIYLNSLGYNVTGVDLSEESIKHAKQFEKENLNFRVHDMSKPFPKTFDAVFNLFTSFGYFDDFQCNQQTISSIKSELNPNGFGVIDFMNVEYVIHHLVHEDVKHVDGINFLQKRKLEDGFIVKDISFEYDGQILNFQERVKAFTLEDFESMFRNAKIDLLDVFGDYDLQKFNKIDSPRLIMIFK